MPFKSLCNKAHLCLNLLQVFYVLPSRVHGHRSTQSITIDALTIENQGERISIYGSLQIHQDQQSLEHVKTLLRILEQTVATLESQSLAIKVQQNSNDDVDVVKNPFLNDTNSE